MSDKPHLLIIGVGSIGERHLRCFLATKRCTVAFCEPDESRRFIVADRYGVTGYADWPSAVRKETFCGAVIATPAPQHIPIATTLTERGLHLLIEKPLSLSLDNVDALGSAATTNKTQIAVGFTYRSVPPLQAVRAAVQSGRFGRLVQLQVQSGQHFPFYRPAYREIYYADAKQGGGLIQDMLPHFLNAAEWIAGPTTKVVVDASHKVLEDVNVEDTVNLLGQLGDISASYTLNQHQSVNESVLTVLCDRGAVRCELTQQRWLSAAEIGGGWNVEATFDHQRDDYYILQANSFLDLIDHGNPGPLCSLEDAVTTLKSTLAVLESARTKRWEAVDS